ncbi:MAG: hypothetical protein HZB39_10135 [Planctomycetes bacterium]|nr:hypothetical protein [Planctomycetota bacterium]
MSGGRRPDPNATRREARLRAQLVALEIRKAATADRRFTALAARLRSRLREVVRAALARRAQ